MNNHAKISYFYYIYKINIQILCKNMSEFIEKTDYDATLHSEILDALTRDDDEVIETCEDAAIMEMRSYLGARYDCDKIFARRGTERNALILMYAKDIAVYHIFCVHNPYKMSKLRKDRYDRAVEWLKAVAKSEIMIDGADALAEEATTSHSPFEIISNPLTPTHY